MQTPQFKELHAELLYRVLSTGLVNVETTALIEAVRFHVEPGQGSFPVR